MEPLPPHLERAFRRAHRPNATSCVATPLWVAMLTIELIAITYLFWRLL